jgi:hypothetical protein
MNIINRYRPLIKTFGVIGLLLSVYYGILQIIVINLLTVIYLIYRSIYLLENNYDNTDELRLRLTQWITYSFFMILEHGGDYVFSIVPLSFFYYVFKLVLFLWVIQSEDNLNYLYRNWVLHYYQKYQIELGKSCEVMEKISFNYKNRINMYMKDNYIYMKKAIFNYIDELIREKIINKEDDITKLLKEN